MAARNCSNRLGLSEEARAVEEYSPQIKGELMEKGAAKVFSLGDLRLYECPLSYIMVETAGVIRLIFLLDSTGHLLFSGGWAMQPYWLAEAYEIFKRESARAKEKENGK
ncbi:MAG: hypothetical protein HY893_03600 [Deltaproteobacteria bacterium]|nr:hypothetical protein [Deltaproteobacteria bacterium]